MKKSLLIAAIVICAAGVASAAQAPLVTIAPSVTLANADVITKMNPGGGSGDVTSMKTINGGGSGDITSANGGGSSCLTAQAWAASLGTATMAAWSPPDIRQSFVFT